MWVPVEPSNPPGKFIVALYNDNCGAACFAKFDDDDNFYHAEDMWAMNAEQMVDSFSMWAEAPEGWYPYFMDLVDDREYY